MRWVGRPVIARPSKTTLPAEAGTSPETERARVDLPAPFAPNTASTDPGPTSKETPNRAWDGP